MENLTTSSDDLAKFLKIVAEQGFINQNTAAARRTAINKLFAVLDPDQQTAEYVRDNLDVVRTRFANRNPEVTGATIDEYVRRVSSVIEDYFSWKRDRSAWEKGVSAKNGRENSEKRRVKTPETDSTRTVESPAEYRKLTVPVGPGRDIEIKFPSDLTKDELRRLGFFVLPYCKDFFETSDATAQDWMFLPAKARAERAAN